MSEPGKHAKVLVQKWYTHGNYPYPRAEAEQLVQDAIAAAVAEAVVLHKAALLEQELRNQDLLGVRNALQGKLDEWSHDFKQLRDHMGCDGSDLPQLIAAWDALKARAEKAELLAADRNEWQDVALKNQARAEKAELDAGVLSDRLDAMRSRAENAEASLAAADEQFEDARKRSNERAEKAERELEQLRAGVKSVLQSAPVEAGA